MELGVITGGMPPELGNVLMAIAAVALAIFFGMFYSVEIAAALGRFLKWLSPSQLLARCRRWFATHKASH